MKKRITVQKINSKEGISKAGKPYIKYSISDGENLYNSFQVIQAVEGGEYEIEYEVGQYGNNLKSIKQVSQTENKLNNNNRQNSIIRQHSQEMALRFLHLKYLGNTDLQGPSFEEVIEMTNKFEEDVKLTEEPF